MMQKTVTLNADRRTATGKGPARQLRMNGRFPAVIYGRDRNPETLSLSTMEFERTMTGVAGTAIVELSIDGKSVRALIREIQRHPIRPGILHIDFYEVREGETLTLDVPIQLVGVAEGVKVHGGVLDQVLREVEIQVLPRHIPDHVELDVSALAVAQSLHVSDLKIAEATILTDPGTTICTVVPPRVEEEAEAVVEEEEVEVGAEPELIRKPKEGEAEPEASGE